MNGVLVVIGGVNINNFRYADDTALICFCPTDLQRLVTAVSGLIWRELSQLITESFEDS